MQSSIRPLAATILSFAALLHLVRVLAGWSLTIGSWTVPGWLSLLVFLLVGGTAWQLWNQR